MSNTKPVPASIIELLGQRPPDAITLLRLGELVSIGRGREAFELVLDAAMNKAGSKPDACAMAMRLIEGMMDSTAWLGGYLMARLYPKAEEAKAHGVCDAIELWMADSASHRLADTLDALAREGVRPRMQKLYTTWSLAIRRKLA
ncbi:MAG TPA: hypothetical protein VKP30_20005 [Polyangiaceae bacterium]|nr:hypothetical protein [Polyangiaceae bacterium]